MLRIYDCLVLYERLLFSLLPDPASSSRYSTSALSFVDHSTVHSLFHWRFSVLRSNVFYSRKSFLCHHCQLLFLTSLVIFYRFFWSTCQPIVKPSTNRRFACLLFQPPFSLHTLPLFFHSTSRTQTGSRYNLTRAFVLPQLFLYAAIERTSASLFEFDKLSHSQIDVLLNLCLPSPSITISL